MRTVTCKRCHNDVPKYDTRQSKLYGGRICASCYEERGRIIEAARSGMPIAPRRPFRFEDLPQQKTSAINRVRGMVKSLFRRRGVQ